MAQDFYKYYAEAPVVSMVCRNEAGGDEEIKEIFGIPEGSNFHIERIEDQDHVNDSIKNAVLNGKNRYDEIL